MTPYGAGPKTRVRMGAAKIANKRFNPFASIMIAEAPITFLIMPITAISDYSFRHDREQFKNFFAKVSQLGFRVW
jgi:hypothetical protein